MSSLEDLLALLQDNTSGDISAADLRDVVTSLWDGQEPVAGLDTVGWLKGVFIENGGVVPEETPPYTLVIEADE